MARVTVEDCIVQIPNRFELVMFASQRARDISAGAQITLDRDRDKNPVVALREIAEMKLDQAVLKDSLISGMQKHADVDKPEEVIAGCERAHQPLHTADPDAAGIADFVGHADAS